jgi:hypothetical protein
MAKLFPAYTDCSWGRPGAQNIRNAGYLGVGRYLGDPANGRNLSKEEMDSYHQVGLRVFFIWEQAANRVLSGFSGGAADGPEANRWADSLGVPNDVPIIGTTVDFGATADQLRGPIADYAKGFARNSKRVHLPYGSYDTLEILCGELGLFPCGWQTAGWSGYGSGSGGSYVCGDGTTRRVSRYSCMFQDIGYVLADTSDHNGILMSGEAQKLGWLPGAPAPTPRKKAKRMKTFIWSSSKNNRDWLESIHFDVSMLPGGWDHQWAGLAAWEVVEGQQTIRLLTAENKQLLDALRYAEAVTNANNPVEGWEPSIVDMGFMESKWFRSRTLMPNDKFTNSPVYALGG